MGAKSTKHKDTEGEPSPSPRKSPKRSSSRSSSREGFPLEATTPTHRPEKAGTSRTRDPADSRERSPVESIGDKGRGVTDTSGKRQEGRKKRASKEVLKPTDEQKLDTQYNQSVSQRNSEINGETHQNGVDTEFMDTSSDSQKENMLDSELIVSTMSSSPRTPSKLQEKQLEPLTPLNVNESCISQRVPQATSTPAPNGYINSHNGQFSPDSDPEHTDGEQSDDEAFTPTDQHEFTQRNRSASPSTASLASQSTVASRSTVASSSKRSLSESDRKLGVNYGKFYTTSYLEQGKTDYLKRASHNTSLPKNHKSPHFHRPANFSYSKEPPDFTKRKKSGMEQLATGTKIIVRRTRRASSPGDLRNDEAVRMSMFPGGKPPKPNEVTKIEREDWPGPPSPASILPEIMKKRRKSRGEAEDDEEDDKPVEDPKIQKEIEEISKFKDTSGLGSIIYKELEVRKQQPPKPLDPWKASRVPSAKYEPRYGTRYQSPMFASPSRFLDRPKRAWDDSDITGYRTISMMSNIPIPKPGYGNYQIAPRAATLPTAGFYGGPLHNYPFYDYDELGRQRPSAYTSTSTVNTDHGSRSHVSSIHEGPGLSLLVLQRSTWHTDIEPPIYPYDRLKITNFDLPRDTDRNMLEIHLNNEDFEELFKVPRDEFYRMAEWKRNDLKRKVDLF